MFTSRDGRRDLISKIPTELLTLSIIPGFLSLQRRSGSSGSCRTTTSPCHRCMSIVECLRTDFFWTTTPALKSIFQLHFLNYSAFQRIYNSAGRNVFPLVLPPTFPLLALGLARKTGNFLRSGDRVHWSRISRCYDSGTKVFREWAPGGGTYDLPE